MKATFLSADVPLSKEFKLVDGVLTKFGHPRVMNCTSYVEPYETIEDFFKLLVKHAELGHCFLKGNVTRDLVNESRAGSTDPDAPTQLLLLDLDGLKTLPDVPSLVKPLGLSDVDYIEQFSASHGVMPARGLSCHVFMLLNKEYMPDLLKQWLMMQNLSMPELRKDVVLTRTANALRWPLDVTTCQNDKLIYIAPPLLGPGVVDELKGQRINLVKGSKRVATLSVMPNAQKNKDDMELLINSLRSTQGLPPRQKFNYRCDEDVTYLKGVDKATLTGIKRERGFVYFNLNGGDSWAYYHPENNPKYIRNFKGEPAYLTKEILPEYWEQVSRKQSEKQASEYTPEEGNTPEKGYKLAFRDMKSGAYMNGFWDAKAKELVLHQARGKEQLRDFLGQYSLELGDYVPDWDMVFDPQNELRVDIKNKKINLFNPTAIMKEPHRDVVECPGLIYELLLHVCGGDKDILEHFLNWLAVIAQYRCRTETAWVFNGTEGTGKGITLDCVLRPIFGYVTSKQTRHIESQFNEFMEKCLILWIDESENTSNAQLEADIKNWISGGEFITIRKMYQNPYDVFSYVNMIFASNKAAPLYLTTKDRRLNVAVFQPDKIPMTDEKKLEIKRLAPEFYHYLMTRKADRLVARTCLDNSAKDLVVAISMQSIDVISGYINKGNLEELWALYEEKPLLGINTNRDIMASAYKNLMQQIAKGEKPIISGTELHLICEYTIGSTPQTPQKFWQMCNHHNLYVKPVWDSLTERTIRGIKVDWKISEALKKEILG